MTQPTAPVVKRNDIERRYEIAVDGALVGLAAYRDLRDQRVFYHTEIGEDFAGHGLAAVLVGEALADARAAGKRIVAVCPYVAKYLKKHDGFADITDPVTHKILKWLETELR